jgi:hypothetical protein
MTKSSRGFVTDNMLRVLRTMKAAEDAGDWEEAELVRDGGREWWLGYETVAPRTVERLVTCMAVSDRSDEGKVRRLALNGTGKAILEDPLVAEAVMTALRTGGAFDERGRPIVCPE